MADATHAPTNVRYPGLTPAQVEESRRTHGANVLTPPERDPWWKQWLSKFEDPVIRILIIAAVIQIAVGAYKGEFIEGLAIVAAILLATTLAFVNEYKANREFDILNKVNDDTPVKVIRGGEFTTVPKRDVVVGDAVLVETGEEVPCDGELVEAVALQVDESKLTGESVPVAKATADKAGHHSAREHAYAVNRVNRGTMVADGHGIVTATAVGDGTEIGKTAKAAGEETGEETPLNEQLEKLSKWIGVVGLGIASLTFLALVGRGAVTGGLPLAGGQWLFAGALFLGIVVALSRVWLPIVYDGLTFTGLVNETPEWIEEDSLGKWLLAVGAGAAVFAGVAGAGYAGGSLPAEPANWLPAAAGAQLLNYFMIAVVIIVVAVPEGLAMSVTLSLAYSMRKMTAQNTLVRKMHACETIGAATVICSDKTGTLTMNEMRVSEAKFPALNGTPLAAATAGTPSAIVVDAIAANSTAQLAREDGTARALGNPTEGALLLWLDAQGVNYLAARSAFRVGSQLPFSTDRKYMATAGTDAAGTPTLHVKGAPEIVLEKCDRQHIAGRVVPLDDDTRTVVRKELTDFQGRGMRTIGLAYREVADPDADIGGQAEGLVWLGFTAISDPVRPEVPAAVAACHRAGIGVKIVTGDTPATAREIGRQIGLTTDGEAGTEMTGAEFEALTDEQAADAATRLKILARARPMHKLRLVRLLQERRAVVAVTGDGTNDAPALNYAKVGLAMGKTGTAVAKEAADIVLLDDSFGSIVTAVRWGRGLYENIQRFILFQLTINVVALGVALLGPFVGIDFPLTVMQMLWVNLIMDTFAALALATEPPHAGVLRRKPRDPVAFIVTPLMARLIFGIGGVFLVVLLGMIFLLPGLRDAASPDHLWSLTVFFSTFVILQFWNLFNARTYGTHQSAFAGLFTNVSFLGIAAAILFGQIVLVQLGGDVFRTVPLTTQEWAIILAVTSPVLIVGEVVRAIARQAEAKETV